MIIAPENFQEKEFSEPKEIFEEEGFEVVVASKFVKVAKGMTGREVEVDLSLEQVKTEDYGAVVFIGGIGAVRYQKDDEALRIAKESKNILAAICIAPTILACAGVLDGRKATVWNKDRKQGKVLESKGADFVDEAVVVEGLLITGNGPMAAKEFGKKIVETLKKKGL